MGPNSGKATGSVHTVRTACRGALGRGSGRRDLDGGLSSGVSVVKDRTLKPPKIHPEKDVAPNTKFWSGKFSGRTCYDFEWEKAIFSVRCAFV
jgi:hypothetical protein